MSNAPHPTAHLVVAAPRWALAALTAATLAAPTHAYAEEPSGHSGVGGVLVSGVSGSAVLVSGVSGSGVETAPRRARDYRVPLGLAYGLAPLLALGAGALSYQLTDSPAAAIASGTALLALPAATHAFHGEWLQGAESFGSLFALLLGGGVAGGLLGQALPSDGPPRGAGTTCTHCEEDTRRNNAYAGAAAGVTLAYMGYAVFDIVHNAQPRPPGALDLALSVQPLATSRASLDGIQLNIGSTF